MQRVTLDVSGMTCGHCVSAVRTAAAAIAGVTVEQVEIGKVVATIDPEVTSPVLLAAAIADEGYAAVVVA
jgi:copper chaperone